VLAAAEYSNESKSAKIQLYDAQSGQPKQELEHGAADRGIVEVAFTPDGKTLVSACRSVKFWDARTGKLLRTLDSKGSVTSLAVSPDGRHLATCGFRMDKDKPIVELLVWDARTGELKQTRPWQDTSMWPSSIAFSPDGSLLAITARTDPDVRVKGGDKTSGELRLVPLGL
jgi:WD40 repeat protein